MRGVTGLKPSTGEDAAVGCVEVYTGDGKGKTTAALGLLLRAVGQGRRVVLIQFMKGSHFYGELKSLAKLKVDVFQYGRHCVHDTLMTQGDMECLGCGKCFVTKEICTAEDRELVSRALKRSERCLVSGEYSVVVLDEILNALNVGLLTADQLLSLVKIKNPGVELVMTGRNAPPEIIEAADLVTVMHCKKHAYDKGIMARRGIEY